MPPGPRPIAEAAGLRPPRLVALDVDGTLLTSDHRLSPATVDAVRRVRRRGVEVVLASSRGACALAPVALRLGLTAPAVVVASQGAVTGVFTADGALRALEQATIPVPLAREVVSSARAAGLAVNWYAGMSWLVSAVDAGVANEARIVGVEPVVRDLLAEEAGPEKLMLVAPASGLGALRSIAAGLPAGLRAQVSNPTYLEITRADVDKAEAVRRHCERLDIAPDDVVAIGDGPNDLGLFALAATSVAPASARAEVLAAATFVTSSNDDDGVARALAVLVP